MLKSAFRARPGWKRDTLPAFLVLLAGFCVSALIWRFLSSAAAELDRERFHDGISSIERSLYESASNTVSLIETVQAFLTVSPTPKLAQWQRFARGVRRSRLYRGVRAIGMVSQTREGLEVSLWAAVHDVDEPPPADALIQSWRVIVDESLAKNTLGLVEPFRADSEGSPWWAAAIQPIYRPGADTSTIEARRAALSGFAVVLLESEGFFSALAPRLEPVPGIAVRIYHSEPSAERLIFSNISDQALPAGYRPRYTLPQEFGAPIHHSRVVFSTTPTFDALADPRPRRIFALSLFISVLLAALVWSISRTHSRALRLAERMSQLSKVNSAQAANFKRIADWSDNGLMIADADLRIRWVNGAIVRRTGIPFDDFIGQPLFHLSGRDSDPAEIERTRSELKSGVPVRVELTVKPPGGASYRVEIECQPIVRPSGALESVFVITRLSDAATNFRDSLVRVRRAVDSVSDAICIWDSEARLVYQNPAFSLLFGRDVQESERLRGTIGFANDPVLAESVSESIRRRVPWSGEFPVSLADGSIAQLLLRVDPIFDDAGVHRGSVAVHTNITARKQLEQRLVEARDAALEASRLKTAFLANMSHELRTPLNGLIGMLKLLLTTRLDAEQREYANLANVSADSLLRVINDILDFSKIEAGKLSVDVAPFDPVPLLEEIAAITILSARAKGIGLALEWSKDMPRRVWNDANRLRQILMNLISNAIKFTHRGGVRVVAGQENGNLYIEVIDTGVGIAPEVMPRLFQPFVQGDNSTTRRFGGTGLGLAISRQLAELMGGSIGGHSRLGEGSRFWLWVPSVESPEGETTETVAAAHQG